MHIESIFNEARKGSIAAQKYLFDKWSDTMFLLCKRYVRNREDAEEVLLDGFYKFFVNLRDVRFQGEAALAGWLKRIMINQCLMFLRKKNAFTIVAESGAADTPLDEVALSRLSASEINKLIQQLPVGYRTVFNLFVVEGYGHIEIAAMTGITEGTSKSQLSKARSMLQKMLLQKETHYEQRNTQ
ncbi:MAG: sigma-70 family RNA polymerase sigma factor [Bacteroidota bacterium]|nr:sigma-70 family RNA polymerase sigma factor [Bacteroidota bacterium]